MVALIAPLRAGGSETGGPDRTGEAIGRDLFEHRLAVLRASVFQLSPAAEVRGFSLLLLAVILAISLPEGGVRARV